ncbi:MAG: cysteine--tRNA ligase [Rhodospirillales bacterium]|nr:MAG: cysteine--tRNA ligase [Rhodospirillales bacterium]
MALQIYNTLSRQKERFEPLDPGHVRLYVCGPTVYDLAHIGNARPVVVFDVLYRLLRHLYSRVTYVRNITDVDDKIIAAHRESGEPIGEITRRTTEAFHRDMAALGALAPDAEPRATDHIGTMVTMIQALLDRGHAYVAEGHVLFSVASWPDYGCLSGRNRDEQIAGARVEVAPYKRDPADFVLWKPSTEDVPGWHAPWGRGRPGWHIECSAMSQAYLGETFDIHGGGQDLIFPHHENEIAQSTCAHGGRPFVRYWMHNGYVMVEGEKMSKSLGNFYTVHDLLQTVPGEAIRLVLLQTHYRQPLDFTHDALVQARHTLDRLYGGLRGLPTDAPESLEVPDAVVQALMDDLNTPRALAHLHELAAAVHRSTDDRERTAHAGGLRAAGRMLGLLQGDAEAWFRWQPEGARGIADSEVERLIADRAEARTRRDFATADAVRDRLQEAGVVLEDTAAGTTWRRA